jgi:organic radical activating enzyme
LQLQDETQMIAALLKQLLDGAVSRDSDAVAISEPPPAPAQPETAQPETAQPETAQPETAQPETAQPETTQPETAQPETAQPETAQQQPDEQSRYLSCRFLERAATFYPGEVDACCANPATGKTLVLARYQGGQLDPETVLKARERIIARHKAGDIDEACRQCPRLTEEAWGAPGALSEYAIDEVTIANFTSCNIRCNYCYTVIRPDMAAPLSKQPRILPTFQQLIERNLLAPNATVRFSGGEPILSQEFEPLLKLLTNHGVRSVVYTNATKRSDAIMEALAQDKVELVLGIDAATVQTYKAIKKMNYNEKVWAVVAEYCRALPPNATNKVWAKFIFCMENFHEARLFVERAHASGARHVYYDIDSSRVHPGAVRQGRTLPEEICDYLAVLRYECEKRGIHVEFAQSGLIWLTPEREPRVEREIERLQHDNAARFAAPPVPEAVA